MTALVEVGRTVVIIPTSCDSTQLPGWVAVICLVFLVGTVLGLFFMIGTEVRDWFRNR